MSKLKIHFGYSIIQSLKTMTLYPLMGVLGFVYGLLFLTILIPVMYFFPSTVDKIAEFDHQMDTRAKVLINNE